jgi:hypothetical protein
MRKWINLMEAASRPTPLQCAEICAQEWPEMTGDQYCCDMSYRLAGFMLAMGYEAHPLDLSDHIDAPNRPLASGSPELDFHYVVLHDDLTYDLTYRQFDKTAPCPRVVPMSEIRKEWRDVRFSVPEEGSGGRKQMQPGIDLANQMLGQNG